METDNKRVIDRIRKMLALSNDAAATEGERDNALRMAHATMAKYNLDMAECEASGGKVEDEERVTDRSDEPKNSAVWARYVAQASAKLFFCYFITSRGGKQYVFIGRKSNILTAKAMAQYLIDSIGREASRLGREQGWFRTEGTDFRRAAAAAIYNRVEKMIHESKKPVQMSSGTSLVLANVYDSERTANALMVKQEFPRLTSGGGFYIRSSNASAQGRAFGQSVSLNRQVGGSSNHKRLT